MGRKTWIDLAAGTGGGAALLVVGHPFDTVKVHLELGSKSCHASLAQHEVKLQSSAQPIGTFAATAEILKADGALGLFKGMGLPLATVAALNAVLFATRGQMEQLLVHEDGTPFTVQDQAIAGFGAGSVASLISCPTELIKCRLQADKRYKGPADALRQAWNNEGRLRGLYKGYQATYLREAIGSSIMFAAYELVKKQAMHLQGVDDPLQLSPLALIGAGGLAGMAYWVPVFPFDVVKSRLQIDDARNPKYAGTLDCARKTYQRVGLSGFYGGFWVAAIRSFPANASCFVAYEGISNFLNKNFN